LAPIVDDWAWVQPDAAPAAAARTAVRLPISDDCEDRRNPRLIGDFVVFCADGKADRALDLRRWTTADLGVDGPWTAVGGGLLSPFGWFSGGRTAIRHIEAIGPLASDGTRVLATLPSVVRWWPFNPAEDPKASGVRFEASASPLPWYPPAIAGDWLVWVEAASPGDSDLWAHPPGSNDAVPFATGPGLQHHVAGFGRTIAWIDDGDVIVGDTAARTRTRWPARAGSEGGLLVDDGFVCWADRGDVVRCTDGWTVPGRRPSGDRSRILVQREDGWWLYRTDG
jgi:hypothetical protein